MEESVQNIYGHRLRIRACGICIEDNTILMVNHLGITPHHFWAPPGGGIEFGESAPDCLIREFKEETGLDIEVCDFLFGCEFMKHPLHAIELFFQVKMVGGVLKKGTDPESGEDQIIKDVAFIGWKQLDELKSEEIHGIFQIPKEKCEISQLRGYFKL
ncbi:MAG: NUDIX domain-containing protein [Cyclobacteriaceae bacterium]|nr:NUDIX domain-containing protein [Cyclobacteriaceae bacterium]